MKYIREPHGGGDLALVGGKGYHLQQLTEWGAPVPPFFILTTSCFDEFNQTGKIPEEVKTRIHVFFKTHPEIALRSSMIGEDQFDASFAGLFETILGVSKDTWEKDLVKIFQSVYSPRVQEYLSLKKIKIDLKMAVVVQELIHVEKSGVLFTRSPMLPTSAIAIDAAFGMGEGVVSGHAQVDQYLLTRSKEIISYVKNNSAIVLDLIECEVLIEMALKLEKKFAKPCDIEWGMKSKQLFIFQIRPITRSFRPLKYFVDTNLSESYPGTVSPFTAKFVQKAYEHVFTESALILGARGQRLENLKYHYARIIGAVDDHLYYNLENYYAILRALPGGEKNIDNWHKMIGGKVHGIEVPYHSTEPTTLETLQSAISLVVMALNRKKTYGRFLTDLEVMGLDIKESTNNLKNSSQTIHYIHYLISRPLGFGLTVINDIFIMLGLGYLVKMLKNQGISEDAAIDLLKTTETVESIKPLHVFNELIQNLSPEFFEAFNEIPAQIGFEPYGVIFSELSAAGWSDEVLKIKMFLDEYGDRSFEELKLESLPLRNDPLLLRQLLTWAKQNQLTGEISSSASPTLHLNWLGKKVVNFTRSCITMRESTRLWRGRYYHLIRQLMIQLGQNLSQEDIRWKEFSLHDYFSLSHLEWKDFSDKKLSFNEVKELIISRRGWQGKKQQYPEFIQWLEEERLPDLQALPESSDGLKGLGVSPGIIEGVALVLDSPHDAFQSNIKNFILVTKNTDPAWVYIMSRSVGLISEKGSMLSHTAIIGRELGLPTLVGVKGATYKIKTGDLLKIDGTSGRVEIL